MRLALLEGVRVQARRAARVLRLLAGMPDYRRYVEHLQTCHPERPVPSEREYHEEFIRVKQGAGASRCC